MKNEEKKPDFPPIEPSIVLDAKAAASEWRSTAFADERRAEGGQPVADRLGFLAILTSAACIAGELLELLADEQRHFAFRGEDSVHLVEQGVPVLRTHGAGQLAGQRLRLPQGNPEAATQPELPLCLHPLVEVVQSSGLAQEGVIGRWEQDVAQPDNHHVERGVDQAIGLVQGLAATPAQRFRPRSVPIFGRATSRPSGSSRVEVEQTAEPRAPFDPTTWLAGLPQFEEPIAASLV